MTQSAPSTYQAPGFLLSVTSESAGIQTIIRLFRGGKLIGEHRGMDSHVTLRADDHTVAVKVGPFGGISQALLLPPGAHPRDAQKLGMGFTAPPRTFAARVQAWGNRHPDLYAPRHVVIAIVFALREARQRRQRRERAPQGATAIPGEDQSNQIRA